MLLRTLFCFLLAASNIPNAFAIETPQTVRIGTTPVFLDDHRAFLEEWRGYLEQRLERPVVFVQRGSYREISDMVVNGKLDFAWVCGYPYVRYKAGMRLVAVPVFKGKPLYQSYVIVPRADTTTKSLLDLKGKIYAFSDPLSNSGWLAPQAELKRAGMDSATFFRKTFFTWAHRKVVEAVADGLAQGGSVDGYVWETLNILHPQLTARTRVVQKSVEYGFPPIVARQSISPQALDAMRTVLIRMNRDAAGQDLLKRLNLDGFEAGSDALYEDIARNMRLVGAS